VRELPIGQGASLSPNLVFGVLGNTESVCFQYDVATRQSAMSSGSTFSRAVSLLCVTFSSLKEKQLWDCSRKNKEEGTSKHNDGCE
jgi:hypothetical protein